MTPERYERLMVYFDALCDLAEPERAVALKKVQQEEPSLFRELSQLLASDSAAPDVFDRGAQRIGAMMQALVDQSPPPDRLPQLVPPEAAATEPPALLVGARYHVRRYLGSGGGGSVFLAWDDSTQQEVAIKFLRADPLQDPRDVGRFRREFRAISRLDHPGCLKVFAEGVQGDRRYLVMEYIGGGDLSQLRGADSGQLLFILAQLAATLEHVHNHGIVHRDLKPQNVLLCPTTPPQPKLADFGIAKIFDAGITQLSDATSLVGTIDYLAPEQVQGQPVDPRTDLYALGCMIYMLWAGRPPFVGNTFERLSARVRGGPPPLRQLAATASAGLEALALRLLEPDPALRPQSAWEVGVALTELLREHGGAPPSVPLWLPKKSARAFLYRPGFSGRAEPLAEVLAETQSLFAGQKEAAALIAICAEAGFGKSAFAGIIRRKLEETGTLVLSGSVPAQSAGPLAPFPELLARIAHENHEAAPALTHARLHRHDGAAALRSQAAALAQQLLGLRRRRPVALLLEDLHYATDSVFVFLRELLQALTAASGPRPVLLATLRPERRGDLVALAEPGRKVLVVDLPPLPLSAITAIAQTMLGVGRGQLPGTLIETLQLETGGSPLLVQSALRALADQGRLARTESGWSFHGQGLRDSTEGPQAADAAVLVERLARLAPPTRQVLEAAAVVGVRFDVDLLVRSTGLVEDTVMDALDEAIRASVVHSLAPRNAAGWESGGFDLYEFEHVRLVEVLYHGIEPSARQQRHLATGNVLRARPATSAAALAHHFLHGNADALACTYLLDAGREALVGHDYAATRRFLREALPRIAQLPAQQQQAARERAQEGLADAQMILGEAAEAETLFESLLRDSQLPTRRAGGVALRVQRARWLRKLGLARLRAGDTADALATLEQALAVLNDRLPRGRLQLHLRLGTDAVAALLLRLLPQRQASDPAREERALVHRELALLYRWVDDIRTAAHHFAFARAAGRLDIPELLIEAYASVSMFLAFIGSTWLGAWVEQRIRALASAKGDRLGLVRINLLRGGLDVLLRNDSGGLTRMAEGVDQIQALADPVLYAWSLSFIGWAKILASRFSSASADCAHALRIAEQFGLKWLSADAGCARALVDSLQGRFEESGEWVSAILASEVLLALPAIEAVATEIRGGIAFMTGRYREASSLFERAYRIYVSHHLERGWGFLMQIERTEALLLLVEKEGPDAVPELTGRVKEHARLAEHRLGRLPQYRGISLVLWGVYYSRRGQVRRALRLFARALQLRPPPRSTYIDGWVLWRIAFERSRLGAGEDLIRPLLAEVEAINGATGMHGMSSWLAQARLLHRV